MQHQRIAAVVFFLVLECTYSLDNSFVDNGALGSAREFEFQQKSSKLLLFTIKSGIGVEAYPAYVNNEHGNIPPTGKLPDVYRSHVLDNLPYYIRRSGKKYVYIVAEMRNSDAMAAKVVFNVTDAQVDKFSWFVPHRVVRSYPYDIRNEQFNYFSISADCRPEKSFVRRFLIHNRYGGCDGDLGFWVVNDVRDWCPWANLAWKGAAPSMVYSRFQGTLLRYSSAPAERFLIYMV